MVSWRVRGMVMPSVGAIAVPKVLKFGRSENVIFFGASSSKED